MSVKEFTGELDEEPRAREFTGVLDSEKTSVLRRYVADPAISLLKGYIGVPETAVGLADLVTGGDVGRAAEAVYFKPKEARDYLDTLLSPEQQAVNKELQETKGFWPTVAKAVSNPSTIIHSALESLPVMGAGGVVARGLLKAAPKVAPVVAGGVGEGTVTAGQNVEQVRQMTPDGRLTPEQAILIAGSGFLTGAVGVAGGKLAKRLGIADVDTLLAGSGAQARKELLATGKKGIARRLVEGGLAEGVFEELPQSSQEQIAQNLALGKPWNEGVPEAGAMGMLTGAVMGAGANVVAPGAAAAVPTPVPPPKPAEPPATTPHDQILREVARKSEALDAGQPAAPSEPILASQANRRELEALRAALKGDELAPEDSIFLVQSGLVRAREDGGVTILPAGRRRLKMLEDPRGSVLRSVQEELAYQQNQRGQNLADSEREAIAAEQQARIDAATRLAAAAKDFEARREAKMVGKAKAGRDAEIAALSQAEAARMAQEKVESGPVSALSMQRRIGESQKAYRARLATASALQARAASAAPAQPEAAWTPDRLRAAPYEEVRSALEGPTVKEPGVSPQPQVAESQAPATSEPGPDFRAKIKAAKDTATANRLPSKEEYLREAGGADYDNPHIFAAVNLGNGRLGASTDHTPLLGYGYDRDSPNTGFAYIWDEKNWPTKTYGKAEEIKDGDAIFISIQDMEKFGGKFYETFASKQSDPAPTGTKDAAPQEAANPVAEPIQAGPTKQVPVDQTAAVPASEIAQNVGTQPQVPTYSAGNPFAERAARARLEYERNAGPTARDKAMGQAFPLGAGFGRKGGEKRIEATVNRATRAVEALKNAEYLEAQAAAFDRGEINAQGRRISAASQERSEKRETGNLDRKARQQEAIEARGDKEKWQVPVKTWADSTGNFGGGALKLLEGEHREAVENALAAGKDVPAEVLANYPDLKAKELPAQKRERVAAELAAAPVKFLGRTLDKLSRKELEIASEKGKTKAVRVAADAEIDRRMLAPLSEAEEKRRADLKRKAAERKNIDVDRDSLVPAIIKLGGLNVRERMDIVRDKSVNVGIPGVGFLFTKNGMTLDNMMVRLDEYGFILPSELAEVDGGVQALRDKIEEEVNGGRKHWSMNGDAAALARNEQDKLDEERQQDMAAAAEKEAEALGAEIDLTITAEELAADVGADVGPVDGADLAHAELTDRLQQSDPDALERLSMEYADRPDAEFWAAVVAKLKESENANQRKGEADREAGAAQVPAEEVAPAKPALPEAERFAIGRSLTKEQRKSVLETLVDVYKAKGAPKVAKGVDSRGEEIIGYAYAPEYFEKSDITGAMVRYHVTLPDGGLAHPTELFPDYTQSKIDAALAEQREKIRRQKSEVERYAELATDSVESQTDYWQKRSDDSLARHGQWRTIAPPSERTMLEKGGRFMAIFNHQKDTIAAAEEGGWKRVDRPALSLAAQTEADLKAKQEALTAKVLKRADEEAAEKKKQAERDEMNRVSEEQKKILGLEQARGGYNESQLELVYDNLETRPGTTEEQRSEGLKALRALFFRDRNAGASLLASSLWKDFTEGKGADLIGQRIEGHKDLATLAQVLRDPRFETFRVFFTKTGQVVGHTGITSRMPGEVGFSDNSKADVYYADIAAKKKSLEADGYWLLHNHPSGTGRASVADIRFTEKIAKTIDGFKGHVIIDYNEYGLIDGTNRTGEVVKANLGAVPEKAELEHDAMLHMIKDPGSLANLARTLQAKAGFDVLLATKSTGEVNAIAEVPHDLLMKTQGPAGLRAIARVRRFKRMSGSAGLAFVVSDNPKELDHLIKAGVLTDAVNSMNTWNIDSRAITVNAEENKGYRINATVAQQEAGGYGRAGEEAPKGFEPAKETQDALADSPAVRVARKFLPERAVGWTKAVVNKLDALSPLGTLPNQEAYLTKRYLALGKLASVSEETHTLYTAFKDAGDAAPDVYAFLTTKDANPEIIKDAALREKAVAAKNTLTGVGEKLVERGLLAREVFEAHKGEYLPRIYLKHLLDDDAISALGSGKKPSNMGYLKARKDIPEDVRKLILGEITDPAYLVSKSYGTQMRDVVLLDWLKEISTVQDWVLPMSMVEWEGRQVTPFYLKQTAKSIRRQALHYTAENRVAAQAIADRMDETADVALENYSGVPNDWQQIPDAPRYGEMRGLIVRREIFDDIVGSARISLTDASLAEKVLGNGGLATKMTQLWKWSKVAANPPAQIRNVISNGILLHLSGVRFHMILPRIIEAVKDIRTNGQYWQIAKKYGVTESTFSSQELFRVEREFLDLQARGADAFSLATAKNLGAKVMSFTGDVYQFSEALFKTAKIIDSMKKGATEEKAIMEAQKWLFDYSLVTPSMRYLRNAPIGAPFITFYFKALPRMLEVATHHPLRFAPYVALPFILTAMVAGMADVDDDDVDKLKKALPKWMQERGHAYFLPAKDDKGRWMAMDFGYFLPWTMWTEIGSNLAKGEFGDAMQGSGLLGGPLPDIIAAIKTNKDPFSKKEIVNEFDPPARQAAALMGYIYSMAMPTWLTNYGFAGHMYGALNDTVDKHGQIKDTEGQAMLRLFGVNLYPINPELARAENIKRMRFEIQAEKRRMTTQLRDRNLDAEERQEIRAEYRKLIQKRTKDLMKYAQESQVHPNLRTGARQ